MIEALSALLALQCLTPRPAKAVVNHARQSVTGTIKDTLGRTLSGASISLQAQNGRTVAQAKTNSNGIFSLSVEAPGVYAVLARKNGFKPATAIVVVSSGHAPKPVMVAMASEQALSLKIAATRLHRARNQLSRETGGSLYHFSAESIARLPQGGNTPLNQVLLQAPGVVQDSFGQVHIRGDHADVQYRIDGIMLPEGTGGFGQVLNPRFASSVNLLDGALSSQYSYRTAGVVEIHPKQGCENQGGDIEMYGGQRATMQPNFELGGCKGNFSYYVTGFYLQDDLGLESATPGPVAIHDHTQQGQGFGYFSYLLNPTTRVSLITGLSVADYQIPAYPDQTPVYNLAGIAPGSYPSQDINENQLQQVYFGILALQGAVGPKLDYKLAIFDRYSTLHFTPDPIGDLIFNGVASDVLNTDFAYGFQEDTTYRLNERHTFRAGAYFDGENVELDNTSSVFPGSPGHQTSTVPFTIVDNLNKLTWLGGVYLQDEWRPMDKLTLTYGLRWDIQDAFVEASQFEPRIALVYTPARGTTLHAGYARYFTPPPLENISPKTIQKFQNTTNAATVPGNENVSPETDDYFDAGVVQTLFKNLSLGVDSYFKLASNLLDEGQFGQALVYAPFNYRRGRVYGVELTGNYSAGNLSVYGNFAWSIAQGTQVESGQFNFTPQELAYIAGHYVYLDHEQYYTASAGISYRWEGFLFSVDGIYGSGLRDGFANTSHLPGYVQINLGIIRSLDLPVLGKVEGRVSILNLLDSIYQIRNGTGIGVFAPQYGPRRAAYFGLRVPLPFMPSAAAHRTTY